MLALALAGCLAGCKGSISGDGTLHRGGRGWLGTSAPGDGDGDGELGDGDGDAPTNAATVAFECEPGAQSAEPETLRRLTMAQYENTLRGLIEWALPGEAAAITGALAAQLDALPDDQREPTEEDLHGSFRRLDQSLQQTHVDSIYALASAAAAQLASPARLSVLVGDCATDGDGGNDESCLEAFIDRFGARALRRPLEPEDRDFYKTVYGSSFAPDSAAYADVVAVMLNAPENVYMVEHGDAEVGDKPGTYQLSAHELAARLSYQLWQTLPDQELQDAADDGSLLDDAVFTQQVARMIEDERARPALDEFFADWMKVEDLPELDAKNADRVFAAFAGDDLPGPGLRQAMIDEVIALLRHYTWDDPSPLADLLTSELSFAQDEALASIYGIEPWDGSSEPPLFPAGQRPGIFTRALFLSTGSASTRPIMKGVFLRKHVLCDTIPPPPPGANAMPPELRSDMTTREVVEELTEREGTVCAGCHVTIINPLGFATESFDALGRFRSEQRLFDDEGHEIDTQPIVTADVPRVLPGDDSTAADANELMSIIAESGKAEACLARNYFRFTHARWEDVREDGCALESMRQVLAEGGSITDLVRATVETDAFKQRSFRE